jgi:hypothetical protein
MPAYDFCVPESHGPDSMDPTDDDLPCHIESRLNSQVMHGFECSVVNNEEITMIISPRLKRFRCRQTASR